MPSYALVDAFTTLPRLEAAARVRAAVAAAHGVVVDLAFFADEAVRMSVELAAAALPAVREALEAAGVHVFERCAVELDRRCAGASSAPVLALFHVTVANEPELA